MMLLILQICPVCGQIILGPRQSTQAVCPVCANNWKLSPRDKIEVRLAR